jgi:crossover junction endodeoxyribonuclease RusA
MSATTKSFRIWIPGPPVPKGRPRVVSSSPGAKARAYTPPKTEAWAKHAAWLAMAARPAGWPLGELYGVSIDVYRSARRGDVDNYAKAALDALNGIAWKDDAAVTHLKAEILECDEKGSEGVGIVVWVRA